VWDCGLCKQKLSFSQQPTASYCRKFGFTNLISLREGQVQRDCDGEDHKIELYWSIRSGKAKVVWNGVDMSNHMIEKNHFGSVHFGWEIMSGTIFHIAAYDSRRHLGWQYNLFINGKSFFALPELAQLRATGSDDVSSEISLSDTSSSGDLTSSEVLTEDMQDEPDDDQSTEGFAEYMQKLDDSSHVSLDRTDNDDDDLR
jgi:hypothetical protein